MADDVTVSNYKLNDYIVETEDQGGGIHRQVVEVGSIAATATLSLSACAARVDYVSSTLTYIGHATPGTLNAAAAWRIRRVTGSSDITVEWADGNANYDNVWDDRAGLSYS
jgi:hypothetical protein